MDASPPYAFVLQFVPKKKNPHDLLRKNVEHCCTSQTEQWALLLVPILLYIIYLTILTLCVSLEPSSMIVIIYPL